MVLIGLALIVCAYMAWNIGANDVARAAGYVFTYGDDEPLAAMHMYRVLQRHDDVANACEKAANAFLPILKR